MKNRRQEYEKVHSCKLSKDMWDTLALTYEGTSHVKDSKNSMLVHQYELFKMEDNEIIDLMFETFQTIINNLRSLGKTFDNYDYITKILRSLPRRWRPQVTTLVASKDFKKLPMEKNLGMLKASKGSASKAFKADESCGNTSNKDYSDEDELSFISRKIQSIWKHKRGSRWKNWMRMGLVTLLKIIILESPHLQVVQRNVGHSCSNLRRYVSGKTYENYHHITKILRSLPKRWRPQVTVLRVSKDLKKFSMEKFMGMLKVHEMELNKDEGERKGKSIALKAHKAPKGSTSKAFKAKESCEDTLDEDYSIRMNSPSFQGRSNLCGSTRKDRDGRTTSRAH
ncbi:hypothetical protein CR513_25495, partial [Mucuna pruriens]